MPIDIRLLGPTRACRGNQGKAFSLYIRRMNPQAISRSDIVRLNARERQIQESLKLGPTFSTTLNSMLTSRTTSHEPPRPRINCMETKTISILAYGTHMWYIFQFVCIITYFSPYIPKSFSPNRTFHSTNRVISQWSGLLEWSPVGVSDSKTLKQVHRANFQVSLANGHAF